MSKRLRDCEVEEVFRLASIKETRPGYFPSQPLIARMFRITPSYVSHIVNGASRRDVTKPYQERMGDE